MKKLYSSYQLSNVMNKFSGAIFKNFSIDECEGSSQIVIELEYKQLFISLHLFSSDNFFEYISCSIKKRGRRLAKDNEGPFWFEGISKDFDILAEYQDRSVFINVEPLNKEELEIIKMCEELLGDY